MKKWLNGKTVVITGASSGIGKQLTRLFIEKCNAKVIGIARNQEKMEALKKELGDKSENFSYNLFDVSKEENWTDFKNYIEKNNIQITLLINNAGILPGFTKFLDISIEDGKKIMDTNFYSIVYSAYHLMPVIDEKGGVVNICSSDALLSVAGTNYYSASKAAVKAFTQSLKHEYKNKYIGCILPGFTDTNIFRNIEMTKKDKKKIQKFVSPCDVIAKKIFKAIVSRKKYKVIGYDAHIFSLLSRVMPISGANIINGVLRKAKVDLFKDAFDK